MILIPLDLTSLSSFPPVPWLIQSDHALNGCSEGCLDASTKNTPLSFEERPVFFVGGLLASFLLLLLVRSILPRLFLDLSAQEVFVSFLDGVVPLIRLCMTLASSRDNGFCSLLFWSSLRGLAVLHYILLKNI